MTDVTNWKAEAERLRAEVARLSPTEDEIRYAADQDWTGLDGTTAYWLIDRHGDGWAGIGAMMEAWRDAEVQRITAGLTAERDAALAELERVQARGWPSTPEDVRALLGSRCGAVRYALPVLDGESEPPPDISDTYTVSAHDLITCNIAASEMRYEADVELERAQAELERAREASGALVDEIDALMNESDGVAGLHLNGDVADWSELVPGGRFERLSSLGDVRALAAKGA